MKDIKEIALFKEQSTWSLVGLTIITFGIYLAYYIQRQTLRINESVNDDNKIGVGLVNTMIAISYISVALLISMIFTTDDMFIKQTRDVFSTVFSILTIVWGFKARNRVHSLFTIEKGGNNWFHGLWVLLFPPLYFNFKVNSICENEGLDLSQLGQ